MDRRLVGACTALLLAVAGCSQAAPRDDAGPISASAEPTPTSLPFEEGETRTDVIDGQRVRLDLPLDDDLVGVAVYFHGKGSGVESKMGQPWLDSIRAEGWAVASGDLHGDAWGNADAVASAVELADWAEDETGAEVELLIGGSMGGVASLNALIDGDLTANCWYGAEPVIDLTAVSSVPDADAQIAALYGGPPPDSANPAARLDRLPMETRYAVVSSPADFWVPPARHASRLILAVKAAGGTVVPISAEGDHLDESHFRPQDLRTFAADCD